MIIERLERISEKNGDAEAINTLLRQLNPKAPERTRDDLASRLERINRNGGVAVIRENGGRIVAMGTWAAVHSFMRTAVLACDIALDAKRSEWPRLLKELVQYLIGRAKYAGAERMDLTRNFTRPDHPIFRDLGFTEADTYLLRRALPRIFP